MPSTKGAGRLAAEFEGALRPNNFAAFHGGAARDQPVRSGDPRLREIPVPWIRGHLKRSLPKGHRKESEDSLAKRAQTAAEHASAIRDVAGLRKEMPQRTRNLAREMKGGRLRKCASRISPERVS